MRDYYPLVARAVARLEHDTPGARQALFDHLRLILVDQLTIRQPSASPTDIMRERAILEAAIRKVQATPGLLDKRQTAPANAPNGARATQQGGASSIGKSSTRSRVHFPAEAANGAHGLARGQDSAADERVPQSNALLAKTQAIFSSQQRAEQQPNSNPDAAPRPAAIERVISEVKSTTGPVPATESSLSPELNYPPDGIASQQIATRNQLARASTLRVPTQQFADGANTTVLDNLAGIQLLDRLMLDASSPLAPESLKQDAETVLRWLGIEEAKAITLKHYDQFGRAIRNHVMKVETSSPRLALNAASDSVLADDISRVFDRLLDEQQSAMVFDQALTWFAGIWIKLTIALNFIVIIGVLALGSTPRSAIIHLLGTYSPLNTWTWIAEVVALSPALGAIAWRERRLNGSWDGVAGMVTHSLLDLVVGAPKKRYRRSAYAERRSDGRRAHPTAKVIGWPKVIIARLMRLASNPAPSN
jgi:hypothetical protein